MPDFIISVEYPASATLTGEEVVQSIAVEQTVQTVVEVSAQQGPPGPPGVGSDRSFSFQQAVPSATWTITHGMGKYPSVTIIDSAGDEVEGSVHHVSLNQLVVSFSAPFSGAAHLN